MTHQEEDQVFKYATKEDGIGLLNLLKKSNPELEKINTETEDLKFNPTELIELDPTVYKSDVIMELDDVIILTEFQSTRMTRKDDKRCRLYTALVDYANKSNKEIIILVISTAEDTCIREYRINDNCVFQIPVISMKDFDGDEIINKIENKIRNNEEITRSDMSTLSVVPFMKSKRPLDEQIAKVVELLDKLKDSLKDQCDFACGIELLIIEKFIKDERQHKVLTSILRDTMRVAAEWRKEDYENGKKDGMEIGEEKGVKKGVMDTAKNMLLKKYPIEEIMEITELNRQTILSLQ